MPGIKAFVTPPEIGLPRTARLGLALDKTVKIELKHARCMPSRILHDQ